MKLYSVSEEYIKHLQRVDRRVLSNHAVNHSRKYLGLKIVLNDFEYFLPLSSPDKQDYDETGQPRKTILPIYRMFDHNGKILGKILINNMVPVPSSELTYYDVNSEKDTRYKSLVLKELRIINAGKEKIISNAVKLYEQKERNIRKGYLNATVDFKAIERACLEFSRKQEFEQEF